MTSIPTDVLRSLIAEAVREAVAALPRGEDGARSAANASRGGACVPRAAGAEHVTRSEPRRRTVSVRFTSDDDLAAFVRDLLGMFENPKIRSDLRNGRLRFSLAGSRVGGRRTDGGPIGAVALRIDRGVLTERQVAQAADAGQTIIVAAGAVITPLARDKARSLGVHIEKERR